MAWTTAASARARLSAPSPVPLGRRSLIVAPPRLDVARLGPTPSRSCPTVTHRASNFDAGTPVIVVLGHDKGWPALSASSELLSWTTWRTTASSARRLPPRPSDRRSPAGEMHSLPSCFPCSASSSQWIPHTLYRLLRAPDGVCAAASPAAFICVVKACWRWAPIRAASKRSILRAAFLHRPPARVPHLPVLATTRRCSGRRLTSDFPRHRQAGRNSAPRAGCDAADRVGRDGRLAGPACRCDDVRLLEVLEICRYQSDEVVLSQDYVGCSVRSLRTLRSASPRRAPSPPLSGSSEACSPLRLVSSA